MSERGEALNSSHFIPLRLPEGTDDPKEFQEYFDQEVSDEASNVGRADKIIVFNSGASDATIAARLKECNDKLEPVTVRAAGTSITGASVPPHGTVFDVSGLKGVSVFERDGKFFADVRPGVTLAELEEALNQERNKSGKNLFFPPAPTHKGATVIGGISTNAGGDTTYKHGQVIDHVEAVTMILPSGHILEAERDQYLAADGDEESPGGYFVLQPENEEPRRLPIPSVRTPDLPKISVGYRSEPNMDMVRMLTGSEGTFGVITKARIRLAEKPPTEMAMIVCYSDRQAFDLMREYQSGRPEPVMIEELEEEVEPLRAEEFSSIEHMGSEAVQLLKDNDLLSEHFKKAVSLLLVQVEESEEAALLRLLASSQAAGISSEDIIPASYIPSGIELFLKTREDIPERVNQIIANRHRRDSRITKVSSDPGVRFEDQEQMVAIFLDERINVRRESGVELEYAYWGHPGNEHFNLMPKNAREVLLAFTIMERAAKRIIHELHGTPSAEHGLGKNKNKQKSASEFHAKDGIKQRLDVKKAFDPNGIMAPGNIFPAA